MFEQAGFVDIEIKEKLIDLGDWRGGTTTSPDIPPRHPFPDIPFPKPSFSNHQSFSHSPLFLEAFQYTFTLSELMEFRPQNSKSRPRSNASFQHRHIPYPCQNIHLI
jgi:hypothetical protein